MAVVNLSIDSRQISAMNLALANLSGQFNWIAARAMTNSAKAAKGAVASKILPMIKGGPTSWTKRGLIASFAKPDNLTSQVGFQYGEGRFTDDAFTRKAGGVPAGRYMGVNAKGGDRRPKGTELALRRTGLIGNDQFITPASSGVRLNGQGNLPGGQYQRLLSRLRALPEGSSQNAKPGAKRREIDYFIMRRDGAGYTRWELGAEPAFIAKRVGKRGFVPAFFITDQPNYERRFPIQSVAMTEYNRVFGKEFDKALKSEMAYQARKNRL
jgi:hypothetical protein